VEQALVNLRNTQMQMSKKFSETTPRKPGQFARIRMDRKQPKDDEDELGDSLSDLSDSDDELGEIDEKYLREDK